MVTIQIGAHHNRASNPKRRKARAHSLPHDRMVFAQEPWALSDKDTDVDYQTISFLEAHYFEDGDETRMQNTTVLL